MFKYKILVFLLFSAGSYTVLSSLLQFPSKRLRKRMDRASGLDKKESLLRRIYAAISRPAVEAIEKLIRLPAYRRASLRRKLARAHMTVTPEEYYANAVVLGILTSLGFLPFLLLGIPIVAISMPILGVLLFFREIQRVDDVLKELNEQIAMALPQFVSIVGQRLEMEKNIAHIFELYLRDVPRTPLKSDLEKLLARVASNGNIEDALRELDASINVDAFTSFIAGLIDVTRGIDQTMHLEMVSAKMRTMAEDNLRRIALKRPDKVKPATLAMTICCILVFVSPMIMQIVNGIAIFN